MTGGEGRSAFGASKRAVAEALDAARVAKLQRLVGFVGQRAKAIREDFDVLWQGGQPPAATLQARDQARKLKEDVDAALARAAEGNALLSQVSKAGQRGRDALEDQLARYELEGVKALKDSARGLESVASAVRTSGVLATYQAVDTGGLGVVSALGADVRQGGPRPTAKLPGADAFGREAKAFEAARLFAVRAINRVTPPMTVVKATLDVTRFPGPPRPWAEVPPALPQAAAAAKLHPQQGRTLGLLARRFYADPKAVMRAHSAVAQWHEAKGKLAATDPAHEALQRGDATTFLRLLGHLPMGKLRTAVLPLSQLHLHFEGMPVLEELFPPPKA